MRYTLKNELLTVEIDSLGAELVSVKRNSCECEYIWQGDPAYWNGHAPHMFPICGRLWQETYSHRGVEYRMALHGFARKREFASEQISNTELRFTLCDDERTREIYPFAFALILTYTLNGERLDCRATIKNTGDEILPATFGAHPGFCVPLDGKGDFSDYYLEFSEPCSPDKMLFDEVVYASGKKRGMTLEDGKRIRLSHRMFDMDGVFLNRMASSVTLKADCTERSVTLTYPDMSYLGIWHAPKTEAPYVCIEPWCGFPGYAYTVEDIMEKADMFRIEPNAKKDVSYSITFA